MGGPALAVVKDASVVHDLLLAVVWLAVLIFGLRLLADHIFTRTGICSGYYDNEASLCKSLRVDATRRPWCGVGMSAAAIVLAVCQLARYRSASPLAQEKLRDEMERHRNASLRLRDEMEHHRNASLRLRDEMKRHGKEQTKQRAKRVACAILGETRTLAEVSDSLLVNILKPLQADAFLHLSNELYASGGMYPNWIDAHLPNAWSMNAGKQNITLPPRPAHWPPDSEVVRFLQVLQPVRFTIKGSMLWFERAKLVYLDIAQHEIAIGLEYGWIIRTRPDMYYKCSLSHEWLASLQQLPVMNWDYMGVFPRAHAEVAFMRAESGSFMCRLRYELCVQGALVNLAKVAFHSCCLKFKILRLGRCPKGVKASHMCHDEAEERELVLPKHPICQQPPGLPNRWADKMGGMGHEIRTWAPQNRRCKCPNGTNTCLERRQFCDMYPNPPPPNATRRNCAGGWDYCNDGWGL